MAVANPARGLQSLAHVVERAVEIAHINAANTHHQPIGNGDAGQTVGVANADAFREVAQRRRHSAIQVLRVGEAAQRARSPLRRIQALGDAQGGRMRVAARLEFAAGENEDFRANSGSRRARGRRRSRSQAARPRPKPRTRRRSLRAGGWRLRSRSALVACPFPTRPSPARFDMRQARRDRARRSDTGRDRTTVSEIGQPKCLSLEFR